MAEQSQVTLRLFPSRVPWLAGAEAAAERGVRTSSHRRTQGADVMRCEGSISASHRALLEDPQTSGGLMAAVEPADVKELERAGFVQIGEVERGAPGVVTG